ncbi:hypothetical protein DEU56DRAFT_882982 [Suillus clintonianus]|uniref:uncharacterized protein n=1 Tax=Suillus clintonianus TaxID=1904413 RepID=UPI001B85E0D2|nr:uncharacterized protein DEU56DRAFT_882982 [Suillus clintonianus]KAG2146821.1 hypothetical protein DEU56DRAFT_882982 [Suillus clintonianus]
MACVRQCEWGDSPCGLYVEFNKNVVSKHLFEWHGVNNSKGARCKFEGCSAANKTMKNLGRHIATVHLDVTWQCCYCRVVWSRSDAAKRHYPTCDSYKAAKELAGDRFKLEPTKMIRKGYIVPAHGTTSDEI